MVESKQGIQSVELGIKMLKVISENSPLSITEISNLCDVSKSKAYRYLISFLKTGFLKRDENLKYSLGNELTLLGIRALGDMDLDKISESYLRQLRDDINETVAIILWGERGPFFLRWEPSQNHVNIGIHQGSQISVTRSAAGKLFAAYLPREKTKLLIEEELNYDRQKIESFYNEVERVKKVGLAYTQDTLIPAISALCAPVFDRHGEITASLLTLGFTDKLDISENSSIAKKMKKSAEALSKELGHIPTRL